MNVIPNWAPLKSEEIELEYKGSVEQYPIGECENTREHRDGFIAPGYAINGREVGKWCSDKDEIASELLRSGVLCAGQIENGWLDDALANVETVTWAELGVDLPGEEMWWLPAVRDYLEGRPRRNGHRRMLGKLYVGRSSDVTESRHLKDVLTCSAVRAAFAFTCANNSDM